ncbi:15266_t:CDS:2 [Funneliformis mosseae]|uniref:15266_t:CDS:1 n=1 Tax=Funneliformis mosseae TaxID=27381 RepID=A0A9N9C6G0_FUNMO|nr:15266_t:CDS:2 [Funneliformis mosseae]
MSVTIQESPAFHRFATRTHTHISKISEQASPYIDESARRTEIFMKSFKENLKREAEKANWPKV